MFLFGEPRTRPVAAPPHSHVLLETVAQNANQGTQPAGPGNEHRRHAILMVLGSKSCRNLSRTLATQSGMTNEWLKSQGLINIRTM